MERRAGRLSRHAAGGRSCAACSPCCMATSATPGSRSRLVMSPMANTSGCFGRVQSGRVSIRPARSQTAPDASASRRASGEACTPAAQITVRAAIRSGPPGPSRATASASTAVTLTPMRSSTPMRAELARGDLRQPIAELHSAARDRRRAAAREPARDRFAGSWCRARAWPARGSGRRSRRRSGRRRRWPPSASPAAFLDPR